MMINHNINQKKRWFGSKTFSSYEYPLATEAPEITQTTATEAPPSTRKICNNDDKLTELEVEHVRKLQKQHIRTDLEGSQPITLDIPKEIPSNVPASTLTVPETLITTLANGVRVVSQETYGQVCSIGVLGDFGSRHEDRVGTAHLVEMMAFASATTHYSHNIPQVLQDWGATHFANSGREQTLWCLDILRPNVERGMQLLQQVTLEPLLTTNDVEDAKQTMYYQALEMMPEVVLSEAVQQAAYGADQQLGKPHFCKNHYTQS